MMRQAGEDRGGGPDEHLAGFSALLEDSAEDLYEHAPCGYLSTMLDGTIVKINATLLGWLGYRRAELVGLRRFPDLLTVGGRIYHETHFAPLLRMQGELGGVALDLPAAGGERLPVLVTSTVKSGVDGTAQLIRTTVFDARDRRAYERELLAARREADRERERVQRLAHALQRSLLPPVLPEIPGMQVAAYHHPASVDEVGGDFYDLFPLSEGTWGFFLGDVSGKGIDAAMVTTLARHTVRAAAVYDPDPVAVLQNLNTVLHKEYHGIDPWYCTVVHGVLTPTATGCALRLASGGHPPAVHIHADGSVTFLDTPGGQLVGVLASARFTSVDLHLGPGETVLLYTDGLSEARVEGRIRYTEDGLRDFVAGVAEPAAPSVIAALTGLLVDFGDGVEDDTALLALGVPKDTP